MVCRLHVGVEGVGVQGFKGLASFLLRVKGEGCARFVGSMRFACFVGFVTVGYPEFRSQRRGFRECAL